eukprot:COSAG02_NODE_19634_length_872_cov_1.037516_1_plen_78_part_01
MESKKKRASAPVTPSCSPTAKHAPAVMDTNEVAAPAPVAQPTGVAVVAEAARVDDVPVETVDGEAETVPNDLGEKSLK